MKKILLTNKFDLKNTFLHHLLEKTIPDYYFATNEAHLKTYRCVLNNQGFDFVEFQENNIRIGLKLLQVESLKLLFVDQHSHKHFSLAKIIELSKEYNADVAVIKSKKMIFRSQNGVFLISTAILEVNTLGQEFGVLITTDHGFLRQINLMKSVHLSSGVYKTSTIQSMYGSKGRRKVQRYADDQIFISKVDNKHLSQANKSPHVQTGLAYRIYTEHNKTVEQEEKLDAVNKKLAVREFKKVIKSENFENDLATPTKTHDKKEYEYLDDINELQSDLRREMGHFGYLKPVIEDKYINFDSKLQTHSHLADYDTQAYLELAELEILKEKNKPQTVQESNNQVELDVTSAPVSVLEEVITEDIIDEALSKYNHEQQEINEELEAVDSNWKVQQEDALLYDNEIVLAPLSTFDSTIATQEASDVDLETKPKKSFFQKLFGRKTKPTPTETFDTDQLASEFLVNDAQIEVVPYEEDDVVDTTPDAYEFSEAVQTDDQTSDDQLLLHDQAEFEATETTLDEEANKDLSMQDFQISEAVEVPSLEENLEELVDEPTAVAELITESAEENQWAEETVEQPAEVLDDQLGEETIVLAENALDDELEAKYDDEIALEAEEELSTTTITDDILSQPTREVSPFPEADLTTSSAKRISQFGQWFRLWAAKIQLKNKPVNDETNHELEKYLHSEPANQVLEADDSEIHDEPFTQPVAQANDAEIDVHTYQMTSEIADSYFPTDEIHINEEENDHTTSQLAQATIADLQAYDEQVLAPIFAQEELEDPETIELANHDIAEAAVLTPNIELTPEACAEREQKICLLKETFANGKKVLEQYSYISQKENKYLEQVNEWDAYSNQLFNVPIEEQFSNGSFEVSNHQIDLLQYNLQNLFEDFKQKNNRLINLQRRINIQNYIANREKNIEQILKNKSPAVEDFNIKNKEIVDRIEDRLNTYTKEIESENQNLK